MSEDVLQSIRDEFVRDVASAAARAREKLRRVGAEEEWLEKRISDTEFVASSIETRPVVVSTKPRRSR